MDINSEIFKDMKRELLWTVKLFSLTMMLALITPAFVMAQSGKVNFSGNWVLNTEKSTIPEGGGYQRMGGGAFTATQEGNLLTRTRTGQDGTERVTKYTLDGKETTNTNPRFESKSTANWSADGKSLTITTKFNFDGNERTSTEVWSLSDNKTLTIVSTRQDRSGADVKSTLVYEKK
jgi:Tol biopolymer transport system component